MKNYTQGFIEYLKTATTPVQAVDTSIISLVAAGFRELKLDEDWLLEEGGKYYLNPFSTTLIAFTVGKSKMIQEGFRIISSHTDCPTFKVKPSPEMTSDGYIKLNTEVYGGPILNTWLDRMLSLAGRVVIRTENVMSPEVRKVDFARPLMCIPNMAIHFNREVNQGVKLNPQVDLLPIIGQVTEGFEKENFLIDLLAEEIGVEASAILDFDLYVYLKEEAQRYGIHEEFLLAPRIDNLSMVYASVEALIQGVHKEGVNIIACFDNEEVGSVSKQGGDSQLLAIVAERISIALNKTNTQFYRMLARSFIISADGAHAVHPNGGDKSDPTNRPQMNKGIVIKLTANQSYTSESESIGAFIQLCDKAKVPYQRFVNRSDSPGGRTLGPLMTKYMPISAVDVGIPMLAMHSAKETMGTKDLEDSVKLFTTFFSL